VYGVSVLQNEKILLYNNVLRINAMKLYNESGFDYNLYYGSTSMNLNLKLMIDV
jgi:hypothetical protein